MNVFNRKSLSLTLLIAAQIFANGAMANSSIVDRNGNGYIEINNLDDLNEIRHDLNGTSLRGSSLGCPTSGCSGYELTRDLDFDTNGNGVIDSGDWNGGASWVPIGDGLNPFKATFTGQGHIIKNLHIAFNGGTSPSAFGLFGYAQDAYLGFVRLEGARVTIAGGPGAYRVGSLAGSVNNTRVIDVYAYNSQVTANTASWLGGVIGHAASSTIAQLRFTGEVINSNSNSDTSRAGGLVGNLVSSTVSTSYVKGSVTAARAAGLVNESYNSGITRSLSNVYVTAKVSAAGFANVVEYNQHGPNSANNPNHYVISDNYTLGSVSLEANTAGGFINVMNALGGATASLRNNYAKNAIENRVTGARWANFIRHPDATLTVSNNYWVTNPQGTTLPTGLTNLTAGGYLLEDLQCPNSWPQNPACRYPSLFNNWGLSWIYGTDQDLPALSMPINHPWISTDKPDASGDHETLERAARHFPEFSCQDPGSFIAKEKKTSNHFYRFAHESPQNLHTFNARQGLLCKNADQTNGVCRDYQVRYRCDDTKVGGGIYWTNWINNSRPDASGDDERLPARSSRSFCIAGDPTAIEAGISDDNSFFVLGPPQKLNRFSTTRGLTCLNSDNKCKDYEVRMSCSLIGDR